MNSGSWVETNELKIGDILGKYEILAKIGQGGMARVYRAKHRETGALVALKVMERSLLSNSASRRRFLREGKTAASVKHPNVVKMLEIGSWNDLPFIAMELLTGQDLDSYIRARGPMPEAEAIAATLPIVAGVAAVHQAGVVHRDLKPSNIFLAADANGMSAPKLLDFGISKLHGSLLDTTPDTTGSREIIGTPAYLSPEALNGSKELGPLSDQYSIGVVLFECVVGKSPYANSTLLELLQSLATGSVQSPKEQRADLSPELDHVICRAMSTAPKDRFANIHELGRALWSLAEEPARAIWSSQFGEANYTAPILSSATPPLGLTQQALDLRKLTPLPVTVPSATLPLRTKILTGVGAFALFGAVGAGLLPWAQPSGEPRAKRQNARIDFVKKTVEGPTSVAPSERTEIASPTAKDWTEKESDNAPVVTVVRALQTPQPEERRSQRLPRRAERAHSTVKPSVKPSVKPTRSQPTPRKTSVPHSVVNTQPLNAAAKKQNNEVAELFAPAAVKRRKPNGTSQKVGPNGALIFD